MQRVIAFSLALSLLLVNVAWAVDVHSPDFVDHDGPIVYAGDLPDGGDISHCDHCCHGAAHFQGVVAVPLAVDMNTSQNRIFFQASACHSRTTAPPTQPPRV